MNCCFGTAEIPKLPVNVTFSLGALELNDLQLSREGKIHQTQRINCQFGMTEIAKLPVNEGQIFGIFWDWYQWNRENIRPKYSRINFEAKILNENLAQKSILKGKPPLQSLFKHYSKLIFHGHFKVYCWEVVYKRVMLFGFSENPNSLKMLATKNTQLSSILWLLIRVVR